SRTGESTFTHRYTEVLIASIAVFFGSWVVSLMREGRPLPALFGGGGVTLVLAVLLIWHNLDPSLTTWLPFKAPIVNWGVLIVPASICVRAAQLAAAEKARAEGRAAPLAGIGRALEPARPWGGIVLLLGASALPWRPLRRRPAA